MSLKAIHLIVMLCSIVFAFGFAAWTIADYFNGMHRFLYLFLGLVSLAAGIVMIPYVFWFRRKTASLE